MPDAASYNEVVRPAYGEKPFDAMLKIARDCKQYIDDVRFTVVDVIGEEKVAQSKILAAQNGIPLRVENIHREILQEHPVYRYQVAKQKTSE